MTDKLICYYMVNFYYRKIYKLKHGIKYIVLKISFKTNPSENMEILLFIFLLN